jgi:putative Holliday junction resolvase
MRILGIDPGEKNIGVAISDPTGTIAYPLTTLKHISRPKDADSIEKIAEENSVELIVVGQALDIDGNLTFSGRRSKRLAAAIRVRVDYPVILWDESYSTEEAIDAQIQLGNLKRQPKRGIDSLAATVTLQSYLDSLQ